MSFEEFETAEKSVGNGIEQKELSIYNRGVARLNRPAIEYLDTSCVRISFGPYNQRVLIESCSESDENAYAMSDSGGLSMMGPLSQAGIGKPDDAVHIDLEVPDEDGYADGDDGPNRLVGSLDSLVGSGEGS